MTTLEAHHDLSSEPTDPAAPAFHAEPPRSARRVLRKVLNRTLAIPSQVDAFLVDFYPEVYQQTSTGMDRESKLNLLLAYVPEAQLAHTLNQEYPQEMLQAMAQPELSAGEIIENKRIKYTVILSATISEFDVHKVHALISHLRKYTADSELTVEQVRSGSVIVTCAGNERGFRRLHTDFVTGQLATIMGFKVKAIALDSDLYAGGLLPGLTLPPPELPVLLRASRQESSSSASAPGNPLSRQPPGARPAPTAARLGGDPQEDTLRITRPGRRTRLQVWWSLGAAAGVAVVALIGDANLRSTNWGRLPASSSSYLPSTAAPVTLEPSPTQPRTNSDSKLPQEVDAVLMPESPEQALAPAQNLAPRMAPTPVSKSPLTAKARLVVPTKPVEGFVIDLHCQGAVSCRTPAARSTARECLNRVASNTTAGSLALSRSGDKYSLDYSHGILPGRSPGEFVKCWQAEFAKLFGVEKSRWPSWVQLDWMPGERK